MGSGLVLLRGIQRQERERRSVLWLADALLLFASSCVCARAALEPRLKEVSVFDASATVRTALEALLSSGCPCVRP